MVFFQGEQTDMSSQAIDRIEFAHAILINDNSYACGKTLASLDLQQRRVHAVALHRAGIEIESPDLDYVLQNQDTLVVRGKPRRVERIERYLQEGS
jgi:CPA2 family monovalent cation:H+ antiporter-2